MSFTTDLMLNADSGASVFRMAETFAASALVPKHLQGRPADCFIALAMAAELRQSPLMVMQNICIVQGTAGWKAQYVIALANASGVLKDRIDWKVERPGGFTEFKRRTKEGSIQARMENMRVTAFATLAGTGARIEFTVSTEMAISEGWANNEKYTTMPEVMLRYRAAAFLVRFYAPDVLLGMYSDAELETMPAPEAVVVQAAPRRASSLASRLQLAAVPAPDPEMPEANPDREPVYAGADDDEGV